MRRGSGVGGRGTGGVALAFEVRSKSKSASSAVSGVAIVNSGEERNRAASDYPSAHLCLLEFCWPADGQSIKSRLAKNAGRAGAQVFSLQFQGFCWYCFRVCCCARIQSDQPDRSDEVTLMCLRCVDVSRTRTGSSTGSPCLRCPVDLLDMKKAEYEPNLVAGPDLMISRGVRASIQQSSADISLVSRCHPSSLALGADKSLPPPWKERRMISFQYQRGRFVFQVSERRRVQLVQVLPVCFQVAICTVDGLPEAHQSNIKGNIA